MISPTPKRQGLLARMLGHASLFLFLAVLIGFGLFSHRFLEPRNLINIVIQASSTAIVAIGMTFVLLTAGVDLSVGSIMFVGAAVAGKLVIQGAPFSLGLGLMILIGLVYGLLNAVFITRIKIMPFVVTLSTLYLGRGFGLWLTETRAMNLPESFLQIGATSMGGIPVPILILGTITMTAHFILQKTCFGRQIYAVGQNAETARKAGIRVPLIIGLVYVISGGCAAIGGIVSLAQLGAVSPAFGVQKEFSAIAAAVLGGTSLFGGRGRVFPGTLLGAVLIQTVENGLVILNADPYLYPLITSGIIFLAVLIDCVRHDTLARLGQRKIRVEYAD